MAQRPMSILASLPVSYTHAPPHPAVQVICALIYTAVGLGGYARFRSRTAGDILRNFGAISDTSPGSAFEHGIKVAYAVTILASAPATLIPLHDTTVPLFARVMRLGEARLTQRQSRYIIATLVLVCWGE